MMAIAKDLMTTHVIALSAETPAGHIAALLLKEQVGALPVLDNRRRVIGIVSDGDLMRRIKLIGAAAHLKWWQVGGPERLAPDRLDVVRQYVRSHELRARHVMTSPVVTATEDTSLSEIVALLERRAIKRVPVIRSGRLVGMICRQDLLRAIVSADDEHGLGSAWASAFAAGNQHAAE